MKILITGGAGFIGSHLTVQLGKEGHSVTIFDNLQLDPLSKINFKRLSSKAECVVGDVRNYENLREVAKGNEVVIHLAGMSHLPDCFDSPKLAFETNALGTINVLEAARHLGIDRVLFLGSDHIYGEVQYLPIDEHHPRNSRHPYGLAKLSSVMACEMYYRLFKLDTVVLISANVFGEGQDVRKVIPRFVRNALENKPLEIEGGEQTRDFYHMDNLVQLICQILDAKEVEGEILNIGGDCEIKIKDLAQKVIELTGSHSKIIEKPYRFDDKPNTRLRLDISKAKRKLNYKIIVPFDQGLQRVILWARRKRKLTSELLCLQGL